MLKKYTSKTHPSVNIVLPSGKSLHVSFTPITGGSSVYYTKDEAVQKGLESHYKFGKLFKLAATIDEEKLAAAKQAEEEAAKKAADGEGKLKEITVACVDDAKDYLSEKYGVSRTKIRSIKAVQEAAATYGIVFVGI